MLIYHDISSFIFLSFFVGPQRIWTAGEFEHDTRQSRAEAVAAMAHAHKIANAAMRGAPKVLFARRDIAPGRPQEWLWHIRIEGEEHLFTDAEVREALARGHRLMPFPKNLPHHDTHT